MDNIEDENLTDLSWLKISFTKESSTSIECSKNHIDDDLQCLCWIFKLRANPCANHTLKRLSIMTNKTNRCHTINRSTSSSNMLTKTTIPAKNPPSCSISQQDSILQTLNNNLLTTKLYQQSFILIRLSNGKVSHLTIRHFV